MKKMLLVALMATTSMALSARPATADSCRHILTPSSMALPDSCPPDQPLPPGIYVRQGRKFVVR